jgi:hypothetical protein
MKTYDDPPQLRWAGVYMQGQFIFVESFAGYRGSVCDVSGKGHQTYLDPAVSDRLLGTTLLEALSKSRFVRPSDEPGLYDYRRIERDYEAWLVDLMDRYGFQTEHDALGLMKFCYVTMK